MRLNTQEFANKFKTSYIVASNVLKFLVQQQKVTVIEQKQMGKGRPTVYYEVPDQFEVTLGR